MDTSKYVEKNVTGLNVVAVDENGKEIKYFEVGFIFGILYAITDKDSTERGIHTLKVRE